MRSHGTHRVRERKRKRKGKLSPFFRLLSFSHPKKKTEKNDLKKNSYFGTPIVEGPDFVVASAQECCEACANYKPKRTKKKRDKENGKGDVGGGDDGGGGENPPSHLPCSAWVFCGDRALCGDALGQCWLKHLAWPEASNPRRGDDVPWTSGLRSGRLSPALEGEREEKRGKGGEEEGGEEEGGEEEEGRGSGSVDGRVDVAAGSIDESSNSDNRRRRRSYHVAITASGPAVHWQSRVHYYWYLKQKRECERQEAEAMLAAAAAAAATTSSSTKSTTSSTEKKKKQQRRRQQAAAAAFRCEMGGFTRVLHDPAGVPDDLSREIPTFVASPLPPGADGGYVVLNRPWAFVQWLAATADAVAEEFVLMAEPDHLWLRPFPNPCPPDGAPASFPFFYIEPSKEEYLPLVARALGRRTGEISLEEAERIAPIGNSPTWMRTADLRDVAPLWMETSRRMFSDAAGARKAWGWVLEMYGFAVSLHRRAEEKGRWGRERAAFAAVAGERRRRRKEKKSDDENDDDVVVVASSSSSSSSFFPPLSPEASEAASKGRREYRREQRRSSSKSGGGSGDDDNGRRRRNRKDEGEGTPTRRRQTAVEILPRVMLQPPWDSQVPRGAALLHYTYGCDYSSNGTFLPGEKGEWRFDKRDWGGRRRRAPPPSSSSDDENENEENATLVPSPPSRAELRALLSSAPPQLSETAPATLKIVEMILEAAEAIPGWERYSETGVAEEWWDGKTFL